MYKNDVICIKIVEIMALFHIFLNHPSYHILGPMHQNQIDQLDKKQQSSAQFILKDYKSRHDNCVTEIMHNHRDDYAVTEILLIQDFPAHLNRCMGGPLCGLYWT